MCHTAILPNVWTGIVGVDHFPRTTRVVDHLALSTANHCQRRLAAQLAKAKAAEKAAELDDKYSLAEKAAEKRTSITEKAKEFDEKCAPSTTVLDASCVPPNQVIIRSAVFLLRHGVSEKKSAAAAKAAAKRDELTLAAEDKYGEREAQKTFAALDTVRSTVAAALFIRRWLSLTLSGVSAHRWLCVHRRGGGLSYSNSTSDGGSPVDPSSHHRCLLALRLVRVRLS